MENFRTFGAAGLILCLSSACSEAPTRAIATEAPVVPPGGVAKILAVSDIHFNPMASEDPALLERLIQTNADDWEPILEGSGLKSVSPYGEDANYPLLKSALLAMRETLPEPSMIIVGGDLLVHKFEERYQKILSQAPGADSSKDLSHDGFEKFAIKTMHFLANRFRETFPKTQIVVALGNNDSSCGDNIHEANSVFLSEFSRSLGDLIHSGQDDVFASIKAGGYYAIPADFNPNLELVVLNSTFFTKKYKNTCKKPGDRDNPGDDQMDWFEKTLRQSTGKRVWVINHIPVGIDYYGTFVKSEHFCEKGNVTSFFTDAFTDRYLKTVKDYASSIDWVISAHTHMNEFRLYPAGDAKKVPGVVLPSISPLHANNPAFSVFSLANGALSLREMSVYTLDSSTPTANWKKEYDFTVAYDYPSFSTETLSDLYNEIASPFSPKQASYLKFYDSQGDRSSLPSNWQGYRCMVSSFTEAGLKECYCGVRGAD